MPQATSKRDDGRANAERVRASPPPADTRAGQEEDREVENYRDEYDLGKHDPPKPPIGHRSYR